MPIEASVGRNSLRNFSTAASPNRSRGSHRRRSVLNPTSSNKQSTWILDKIKEEDRSVGVNRSEPRQRMRRGTSSCQLSPSCEHLACRPIALLESSLFRSTLFLPIGPPSVKLLNSSSKYASRWKLCLFCSRTRFWNSTCVASGYSHFL